MLPRLGAVSLTKWEKEFPSFGCAGREPDAFYAVVFVTL